MNYKIVSDHKNRLNNFTNIIIDTLHHRYTYIYKIITNLPHNNINQIIKNLIPLFLFYDDFYFLPNPHIYCLIHVLPITLSDIIFHLINGFLFLYSLIHLPLLSNMKNPGQPEFFVSFVNI